MKSAFMRWDFQTAECFPIGGSRVSCRCDLCGGSVSGTLMFPTCKPDRAVSIYHIHGNADPVVYDEWQRWFPKVKM